MPKYEHKIVSAASSANLEQKLVGLGADGWRAINYVALYAPNSPATASSGPTTFSVLLEREVTPNPHGEIADVH